MIPDTNPPVLITGGSGYIASWVVRCFLEGGYTVNTTVRDLSDSGKNNFLRKLADEFPGKLHLFEADLLKEGSFHRSMEGCRYVIHTASPFKVQGIRDAQKELIEPALTGTRNVLHSVNQVSTVERVVLTSSVAAVYNDASEIRQQKSGKFTEENWNQGAQAGYQPYNYSKTVAEKEAWNIAHAQNRWDLVVINPGFVMGPSLVPRTDSTSIDFIKSITDGRLRSGAPDLFFGIVDVREVARAHMNACRIKESDGRNLLVSETLGVLEIAGILKGHYGDRFPVPQRLIPKPFMYLAGPFLGFSWKYLNNNIGFRPEFDHSKSIAKLEITYRPARESIIDQVDKMIRDHILK